VTVSVNDNTPQPQSRRGFMITAGVTAAAIPLAIAVLQRPLPKIETVPATPAAQRLIQAARAQIGITTRYDPAYVALPFPGGDIDRARGVCTDVVIRAYRDAFGVDLQTEVHADMTLAFGDYPRVWGLPQPDANIDHRRVLNLEVFFERQGARLDPPAKTVWRPGDLVTSLVGGQRPHIGIISDRQINGRPLVLHNIGAGTREDDALMAHPLSRHFRWSLDA
jgi:uncharacterized protein